MNLNVCNKLAEGLKEHKAICMCMFVYACTNIIEMSYNRHLS